MLLKSLVALLVGFAVARTASAQPAEQTWVYPSHVRAATARLAGLLRSGQSRSETLRELSAALDTTEWVVFLQEGRCPPAVAIACLLHVVGRYESAPYVRVIVDTRRGHPDSVIALIAHELQHALEVARGDGVTDGETMRQLFRRIGYVTAASAGAIVYETRDARSVEDRVRRELDAALLQPRSVRRTASNDRATAR